MPDNTASQSSIPRSLPSSYNFTARTLFGLLAINLVIALLVTLSLYQSRQKYDERATVTAENLSRVLEHDLAASIDKIDLTLLSVGDEVSHQRGSGKLDAAGIDALLARQVKRVPDLAALRVSDAQGNLLYGANLPANSIINVGDREDMIYQRDHPDAGLVIGEPVGSPVSGKWTMNLTRRLNQPDGSFAGTVMAAIQMDRITGKFAALNIGPHGFIVLRDSNLHLLARYTLVKEKDLPIGRADALPRFKEQLRIAPKGGIYQSVSPIDQVDRVISYRTISGYPFYLLVGLSTDDYLHGWWREVTTNATVMVLFALITAWFSWWMLGSWKHLKSGEQKFRTLLESLPDPLVIADANGLIVLVNKQVEALFGYRPEELLGQPVEVLMPQRHQEAHIGMREGYAQDPKKRTRAVGNDSLRWAVTREGRDVPVNVSLSPIQTEQGLMVAASIRDISERQQAELAIRSRDHLISESQRIAHIGSWHFNLTSQLTWWSDEAYRIFGVSPDTFTPTVESLLDLIHPDDRAAMQAWIADCIANRKPDPLEFRVNRPDGSVAVLSGYGELTLHDEEGAGSLTGIVLDITVRKAAEEQIAYVAYHDALTQLPNRPCCWIG